MPNFATLAKFAGSLDRQLFRQHKIYACHSIIVGLRLRVAENIAKRKSMKESRLWACSAQVVRNTMHANCHNAKIIFATR